MGLLAELGVEAETIDVKASEEAMAGGLLAPEGVHHAVLQGFREGTAKNTGSKFRELTFKILAGPGKDMTVEDALWLPHDGQDDKKKKFAINRAVIFGCRLGLLKKVKDAKGVERPTEIPGKHSFAQCLGAVCFIEVKHEDEEYEKDGKKKTIKKAKLTFEGVLSPDDKKAKGVPTGTVDAATMAATAAATTAAATEKTQFDDL